MRKLTNIGFGLALFSISSLSGATSGGPPIDGALTQNPITGHYYQVWGQNGISWPDAQAFVLTLPCLNPDGSEDLRAGATACTDPDAVLPHLATLTSFDEDEFVEFSLRAAEKIAGTISNEETWIGGMQPAGANTGEGWLWLNSEGSISTSQVPLPSYSNWLSGEPNDAGSGESHLATGLRGEFGWNDEGNLGNIGGFIVEWDVPLAAVDCVVSQSNPDGCTTIVGQTIAFPEASNPNNGTISFNSFEFSDPRVDPISGLCDRGADGVPLGSNAPREPLRIFGGTGIGSAPGVRPEMFIPPYLCGSPKFVVVALDSGQLVIETGTVGVENTTDIVLPGNFYPEFGGDIFNSVCQNPITQDFPNFGDPQYQDVSVWQDTETPTQMVEVNSSVGGVGELAGATGEFTDECGSSRMRVRGGSYFGIGLHIDFGAGNTWALNTAGNFDRFVELTRYKLVLLEQSVKDARNANAISRFANRLLRFNVGRAIRRLDQGRYRSSRFYSSVFLWLAENLVNYNVADRNYNGEHVMRASNAKFTLRVKIIPYAP